MMDQVALVMAWAALTAAGSPTPMSPVSSPLNDYNLSLDEKETRMVFARSEADFRNARIYTSSKAGGGWSVPVPISFTESLYSDSDPWLTPDGATLYFISNRPADGRAEGRTDYDIWRSKRTSAGWSAPEHLGPSVNGPGQELGPELHGDTLFFASARKGGRGGLDIYSAKAIGGAFGAATPLPDPFNSPESESDFTLNSTGDAAMFWRTVDGKGVIHVAVRHGMTWSLPAPLPASVNIGDFNFTPSFSRNPRRIRYASTVARAGQEQGLADVYEAAFPDSGLKAQ